MDPQQRDAHLDEVLIGGREKRAIVIADYDARWADRFELERQRVRDALGAKALRIEHIGSTAVPGLAAKPIVDLLVTVEDADDDDTTVPAMATIGYQLRVRESGHRMFRTADRDVHVHVWGHKSPEVERYLAFREQLRRSPDDRRAYEQLKRNLAIRDWNDTNEYADAKSDLIEAILARADVLEHPRNP